MTGLILYLDQDIIHASRSDQAATSFCSDGMVYNIEEQYFGDWIPLRDGKSKIVGVKLVPLIGNDYLEQHFLSSRFVKQAHNVRIERGADTYITIHLADRDTYIEDKMNRIEAAILRAASGDIVIRLDGFTSEELEQFGFS